EIRVLRALRTERTLRGGRGDGRPGWYRDSTLINLLRQVGRLEYEHIDETRIAPTATPWQPTRRDIGDELRAIGWFLKLSTAHRELIVLRSMNPPYTFRAIGARTVPAKSHTTVRRAYGKAITAVAKIANVSVRLAQAGATSARAAAPETRVF